MSMCEKVQEMSYCVGTAVCRIFDSQTASSMKQIDLLSEARQLLDTEIKRLTKGMAKPLSSSQPTIPEELSTKTKKRGRPAKAEVVEIVKEGNSVTITKTSPQTLVDKPAALAQNGKKAKPPVKAAPSLPVEDLEIEDDLDDDVEEKYPVGFADEDDDEINSINT